jgi:hypothetical protein
LAEFQAGANPTVQDTDGDGHDDFEEILTYATEPNNAWDKPLATSSTKFIAKLNSSFAKGEYLYENFILVNNTVVNGTINRACNRVLCSPLLIQTSGVNNYNFK